MFHRGVHVIGTTVLHNENPRYYIHNLVQYATDLLYTQRCANATNILYTQRRQMATLDAPKVLVLTNKTKLTLTATLTLTDTVMQKSKTKLTITVALTQTDTVMVIFLRAFCRH